MQNIHSQRERQTEADIEKQMDVLYGSPMPVADKKEKPFELDEKAEIDKLPAKHQQIMKRFTPASEKPLGVKSEKIIPPPVKNVPKRAAGWSMWPKLGLFVAGTMFVGFLQDKYLLEHFHFNNEEEKKEEDKK